MVTNEQSNNIITLMQYKEALVNKFNDRASISEMEETLDKKYKDELLEKAIIGTYKVAEYILNSDTINDNYCRIELKDDHDTTISLNVSGGHFSDEIYTDVNGNKVSILILKHIFGEEQTIEFECDLINYSNDPDICVFDERYYLYLQNFKKSIDELKKELCVAEKVKCKKL